ncbi:glycosyltransferase [Vibrio vulnificus]|uniref:glycosyltransferase n=1 Tax=Vibrio vulnificus TaxID=672 RepID=UPI00405A0CA7|nr:glycosyltransferase [Vibrio vulnificus]
MGPTLFSFLMCVHEDNPFIDNAIQSVLEQDYNDFEFIIVANNCSNSLYERLSCLDDSRIRLFRTSIGQLSFNLNYGVDKAKGKYIVRMDSDDICLSTRLSVCEKYAHGDYDVIAFSAEIIDQNDCLIGERIIGSENEKKLLYKNPIIHPAVMIKRESLIKARGYLGGFQSEDYDLWLRMYHSSFKFHFSNEIVLKYRIHNTQSKGALLPYCEVSGYFIRNFLLYLKFEYFWGFVIASIKRFIR